MLDIEARLKTACETALNSRVAKRRAAALAQYYKNKEHRKAMHRKWYHENKDKPEVIARRKASRAKYHKNNKEALNAKNRKYHAENKEKIAKRNRKWYENNKEKALAYCSEYRKNNRHVAKNTWLKSEYGIDLDVFNAAVAYQNGNCLLCGEVMDKPHVDHCHDTGKLRGLLCRPCNVMEGFTKDAVASPRLLAYRRGELLREDHPFR